MTLYRVLTKEVYDQLVWVEAENEEMAKMLVAEGDGDELDFAPEYGYPLDPDTWTVEQETCLSVIEEYKRET